MGLGANSTIDSVNDWVRQKFHVEYHLFSYKRDELVIGLSENSLYYHEAELRFKEVCSVSGRIYGRLENTKPVFREIPAGERREDWNRERGIVDDYKVFELIDEDGLPLIVSAMSFDFVLHTVKYS